jgi:hypothetical protein
MNIRDLENPMVRDELWPEYSSEPDDQAYWDWVDSEIDQARGK